MYRICLILNNKNLELGLGLSVFLGCLLLEKKQNKAKQNKKQNEQFPVSKTNGFLRHLGHQIALTKHFDELSVNDSETYGLNFFRNLLTLKIEGKTFNKTRFWVCKLQGIW